MRLGLYNAVLHDRSLPDAITAIADAGLTGLELNTGGFLPPVHIPDTDDILDSDAARDDFLEIFDGTGVSLAGLNGNGNPLHPLGPSVTSMPTTFVDRFGSPNVWGKTVSSPCPDFRAASPAPPG